MVGVEIDMVVPDSLAALAVYESIFDVQRVEVTALSVGQNEAVFTIYGTRMHLLDENAEHMLIAPKPGDPKPFWLNVVVPDIRGAYQNAMQAGCEEIQPVTEMEAFGVMNAMFTDPFGYIWMLHEIVREVSFEERMKHYEAMAADED